MGLTRDDVLKASAPKPVQVDVPELGGCVFVRVLTGAERDRYDAALYDARKPDGSMNLDGFRVRLVMLAACDENGARLFNDTDTKLVGGINSLALMRVFEAAQKVNGLSSESVEDAVKN